MAVMLNVQPRTERGKNDMRKLRTRGRVPAVVYGHGDETRTLSVSAHDLEKLLGSISVENTIIDLALEGGATTPALIREVQYHPARKLVLHVDFLVIHAGQKIHLEVPIRLHGSPIGVRDNGGILQEVLRDLHVECLPGDIPEAIDLDIDNLDVGDVIHVRDVSAPNVRILNDPDIVLVTVVAPTVAELPEDLEAEEGVAGEGEPEVIRRGAGEEEEQE
jgi:large subunit ribosomal protein L25